MFICPSSLISDAQNSESFGSSINIAKFTTMTISKILIVIHVLEIIAITFNVEPLGLFIFKNV